MIATVVILSIVLMALVVSLGAHASRLIELQGELAQALHERDAAELRLRESQ